ncbi:MAG: hypothetical protein BWY99_02399 [Synergistetes bacterium ADurb.BinA166]|nr:MAG: hypothetical protein BWY99_02399 [Synergistetes bacterium ADurb.BinA166]
MANTCPRKGSSPLSLPGNKRALCSILGGYGRTPVDRSVLSEESAARSDADGPCLTIAVVPRLDGPSGALVHDTVKIFSPPVLHERETIPDNINRIVPKSPM